MSLATAWSSRTTSSRARRSRRPSACATRATSAATREEEWRGFFEAAGLEVDEIDILSRRLPLEPWLERAETPPDDAARVRELLADRTEDGLIESEAIILRGREALMAIIVTNETRLVVQGLTGSEGSFHGPRNRDYGTNVVAGVTPGKGGQDVQGIPVFDTVAEAVDEAGANTSVIFVPARFAVDAIYEAVDAGIETVICVAEGLPAHDMLRIYNYIRPKGITLLGPNCPGALSPGKANVGIIPAEVLSEGRIGLVSRSGTLTYQIGYELAEMGLGNSTIVGIGGDPVVGSSFIDILAKFEADDETDVIVMVGEIGGDEEEKAARYIGAEMSKPVVAYIAGFTAPPGKTMGHAGAIISGSSGTAQAKKEALEAVGVKVGHDADRGCRARRRDRERSRLADGDANSRPGAEMPAVARAPLRGAERPAPGGAEDEAPRPDEAVLRLADGDARDAPRRGDGLDPERIADIRGHEPAAGPVLALVRPVRAQLHDRAAPGLRRRDDRQLHLERCQRRGGQDESDEEGGDEPHVRVGF